MVQPGNRPLLPFLGQSYIPVQQPPAAEAELTGKLDKSFEHRSRSSTGDLEPLSRTKTPVLGKDGALVTIDTLAHQACYSLVIPARS
jgi:hypothetical protein